MLSMLRLDGVLKMLFTYEENTFDRSNNYRFSQKKVGDNKEPALFFSTQDKRSSAKKIG